MRFFSPRTICCRASLVGMVVLTFAVFAPSARAQTPRGVCVEVTATTSATSPCVTLHWPSNTNPNREYHVLVRPKGSTDWGTPFVLTYNATSYPDTNAQPGVAYEYSVQYVAPDPYGFTEARGAIVAGSNIPLVEQRGNVILLVDNTMSGPLASEISQLQQDMQADGWVVYRHDVPRQTIEAADINAAHYAARLAEVQNIRTIVQNDYNANGQGNSWALFILGRVPVPYSGAIMPDGHGEHYGAWPTDLYYADVTGVWTDTDTNAADPATNIQYATDKRNWNVPGDGKLDQNNAPASIALQCGRVDLANMGNTPAGMSETELVRQYLVRDHRFRCKIAPFDNVARRGIVDDSFGYFGGEAFASSGWRTGFSWFGNAAGQMDALDWFTTLQTTPMLFAYGSGAGYYTHCTGVGVSNDFARKDSKAVFNMLFGSYFGDWDNPDNILRAPLAGTSNSLGLVNVWSGRGYFNLFHMALGDTVGYCTRFTQNPSNQVVDWPGNYGVGAIQMNLMGDPTLRLHSIALPPRVTAASSGSGVVVSWLPSPDLPAVDPTVAYWRFEPGNVTGDSGPNGLALSAGGTTPVVSYSLPGSGAGSAFPKTIPQKNAANTSGIQGVGTNQTFGSANYYKTNDTPALTMTKGITVEAFINLTALNANSSTFVSHGGNAANGSWLFRVTGVGTLLFEYAPAASADFWTGRTSLKMNGGPAIIAGHDYYVCISLDLTNSTASGATFYIQDLTAGTALQTYPAINASTGASTHATTLYDTSLPLTIGGANSGALPFSGTIDEVRISNSALDASQLLITSPLSGYHVYRSASAAGPFTRLTGNATTASAPTGLPLATTTTTYTDTTATAGTAYTYLVKAVKMETSASGTYANQSLGQAATISSTPSPAAPTRLVVSRTAAGTCLLTWDDNASDETGYLVERCDPTIGAWSQIISISANSTTYSDTAAPVGKIVSYRVHAQGSAANSAYSNVAADENLPGTFSDNSYSYITTKSVGNFTASALRSNGSAGSVSIDYATSNILGAAGTDYIASSGNLTWANGESGAKSPPVTIPNMSGTQPTKIFKLTYTNPTNGLSAGSPTKTFVYVTDPAAQTLPGTWATTTLGNVVAGQEGYAEQANGKFGLSVLSEDAPYNAITSDSGRFLYQQVTGDFQFTARLNFLSTAVTTNVNTGVMIRGGLNAAAITDTLLQRSFVSTLRGTRTASGGGLSTAYTGTVDYNTPFTPPVWMRIARTGSTVSISKSSDGVTWTKANADTTLALPNTAYVGFYLTSFDGNKVKYTMTEPLSYAQYDNVTLSFSPPTLTASPGVNSGEVALNWSAYQGAASYLLERSNTTGTGFVQIATPTGTSYTDTGLAAGQTYYYRVKADTSDYGAEASCAPFIAQRISGWRYTYFGSEANTGNGANSATPAGDGISNLIKYATGLPPWTPATQAPGTPQIQQVGGTAYLTLTFQRSLAASDMAYSVEATSDLAGADWTTIDPLLPANQVSVADNTPSAGIQTITVKDIQPLSASAKRFMRLRVTYSPAPAAGVLIPAGSFQMGDALDGISNAPVHTVNVSAYYIEQNLVTKEQWDGVYTWAVAHGYGFDNGGSGNSGNHPVQTVDWWDCVKWCNARSEKEGLVPCYTVGGAAYKTGQNTPELNMSASGYRLPTEAEWEKAARGGLSGKRFPWGDTISRSQANYRVSSNGTTNSYSYDLGTPSGYDPAWVTGGSTTYTSLVGSYEANGYGLYDMAGNVSEWCWDWYDSYGSGTVSDPTGPASGSSRVYRGGCWYYYAYFCRVANRTYYTPTLSIDGLGFRCVRR